MPEHLVLAPDEALGLAQRLLDSGRPFHAHEVLESAWKTADPTERDLWQALAQLAVGVTHAARGNPVGAQRLVDRGASRLVPYLPRRPHGIDVPGVLAWCRAFTPEHPGPLRLRELSGPAPTIGQ